MIEALISFFKKPAKETKNEMQRMAKSLNFIEAAKLRDKLFKLKEILK